MKKKEMTTVQVLNMRTFEKLRILCYEYMKSHEIVSPLKAGSQQILFFSDKTEGYT